MELTPQQKSAVTSNSQFIAILAGAGSGKTKTLTERICDLINNKNIKPEEILALTFSSKAAQEMKKRIHQNLGEESKGIWVKTFHSFGLEILKLNHQNFEEKSQRFEIVDTATKNRHIKSLINLHKLEAFPKDILSFISKIKNKIVNCSSDFEAVFDKYNQILRENNLVDLDDLVWLAVDIIKKNSNIQAHLHKRFKHILIDEYQDINDIQNELVSLILSPSASLCIVGDDDQCIYEWRGSKPQYIKEFASRNNVEKIFLSDNFRSQERVVELANKFISNNKDRLEKSMIPRVEARSTPLFYMLGGIEQEASFIANTIKKLYEAEMHKYNDFAILIRSGKQSEALTYALNTSEIPYSFQKEESGTEFTMLLTVLYSIMDYTFNNNISRAINFPDTSLDNFTYMDLRDDNGLNELSILDTLEHLFNSNLTWEGCQKFRKRYEYIKYLSQKNKFEKMKVTDILTELYGFYDSEEVKTTEFKNQLQIVNSVIKIAQEWEKTTNDLSIRAFIDYLVCAIENNEELDNSNSDDAVNILTCHRAKGLEFPIVIIPGVHVGSFPNDYFIKSESDLEQERRLFYVAMTRAVERLIITCYEHPYSAKGSSIIKNGFIAEIPEIVEWTKNATRNDKTSNDTVFQSNTVPDDNYNEYDCYDGYGDLNPYDLDADDYEAWMDSIE